MNQYTERETKILWIDVELICHKLTEMWAKKVFDNIRTITSFDYIDKGRSLIQEWKHLKITEEWKTKISFDEKSVNWDIISIKNKIWRKKEMKDILEMLWLVPIASAQARRISYEYGDTDIDIDIFPHIDPFVEIESENIEAIQSMIWKLSLSDHTSVHISTPEVFKIYDLDYYQLFKI